MGRNDSDTAGNIVTRRIVNEQLVESGLLWWEWRNSWGGQWAEPARWLFAAPRWPCIQNWVLGAQNVAEGLSSVLLIV